MLQHRSSAPNLNTSPSPAGPKRDPSQRQPFAQCLPSKEKPSEGSDLSAPLTINYFIFFSNPAELSDTQPLTKGVSLCLAFFWKENVACTYFVSFCARTYKVTVGCSSCQVLKVTGQWAPKGRFYQCPFISLSFPFHRTFFFFLIELLLSASDLNSKVYRRFKECEHSWNVLN